MITGYTNKVIGFTDYGSGVVTFDEKIYEAK